MHNSAARRAGIAPEQPVRRARRLSASLNQRIRAARPRRGTVALNSRARGTRASAVPTRERRFERRQRAGARAAEMRRELSEPARRSHDNARARRPRARPSKATATRASSPFAPWSNLSQRDLNQNCYGFRRPSLLRPPPAPLVVLLPFPVVPATGATNWATRKLVEKTNCKHLILAANMGAVSLEQTSG